MFCVDVRLQPRASNVADSVRIMRCWLFMFCTLVTGPTNVVINMCTDKYRQYFFNEHKTLLSSHQCLKGRTLRRIGSRKICDTQEIRTGARELPTMLS